MQTISKYLSMLLLPVFLLAQYSDQQLPGVVESYFKRNRTSPTLVSVDVDKDYLYGRTLRIKIMGNRTTSNDDIGFAFGAAAAVANHAQKPIDTIWVEMDVLYKVVETTIAVAPADCSIDAIVRKTRKFSDWWDNCLEFL